MHISKRALLAGTGAALTIGFSVDATAADVTATPLIPIQTSPQAYIFRLGRILPPVSGVGFSGSSIADYYNTQVSYPQILPAILKYRPQDGVPITSLIDAENRVMARATEVTERWDVLPWGLRRQAAYLACSNRRGFPTGVLMHPSMAARLSAQDWTAQDDGTPVGRWLRVGKLHKLNTVYLGNHMPEDQAVMFYRNKGIDAGAVVLDRRQRRGERGLTLIMLERTNMYHAGIQDYVRRVRFV